jgi:hypothetical protein
MTLAEFTLIDDYWDNLEITEADINYLYNYLIEIEKPTAIHELVKVFVTQRIDQLKESFKKRSQGDGKVFLPKETYQTGDALVFPALGWSGGKVTGKRPGYNPQLPPFEVIEVKFEDGTVRFLASGLEEHGLNNPVMPAENDELLNVDEIVSTHKDAIASRIYENISTNPDLICIAQKWFPKALLVDVNIGYLNLAEALLDMEGGGPLTSEAILKQIDLPTDVNQELTEFSLNHAMHQDARFDEVGPTGEVIWYLKRLEPEWVREQPKYLRYQPVDFDEQLIAPLNSMISRQIVDELENRPNGNDGNAEIIINLLYPHWRSGALPLAAEVSHLFPTALESDRVRFTFVDAGNGKRFSGWVVRPLHYIGGLSEWYTEHGVIPGSMIRLRKGKRDGEVIISVSKRRSTRDWMRTVLVGSDGGLVFAMLKQLITTETDDRMAIYVSDPAALDKIWDNTRAGKYELTRIIISMMRELIKLNPQGHVHFEELYAAVNLRYRVPPGAILSIIIEQPWATHLGDLYFNLNHEHLEK